MDINALVISLLAINDDGSLPDQPNKHMLMFKVKRGPTWEWGFQDRHGVGILTGYRSGIWVRVLWGNEYHNGYRVGFDPDECIDYQDIIIELVPFKELINKINVKNK